MAQENCHKIKLLKLMEMLRQETDEQHPMKADEICKRLNEMGISCDRKTFQRDVRVLNDFGFEVMSFQVKHEKLYYVADRSFSVPELKILIDAIQAASFVTEKKTAELIEKIAYLGGSHRADILRSNMVNFNTRKHSNEAIYYSVDCLEDAIEQNRKVIFRYSTLYVTPGTATAKNNATISSYTVTCNGKTASNTTGAALSVGTITSSGNISVVLTVTDSRGYIRLHEALKEGGYFILTDYFALSDEEEQMHRDNLLALKSEQGITDSEFYHYDTPLTVAHETEALLEAGFPSVEVLNNWGATYTLKATR